MVSLTAVLVLCVVAGVVLLYAARVYKQRCRTLPSNTPNERKPHVLVVGAGFSGLGAAVQLKHSGFSFTVLEKAEEVGGTWWLNRYPGCACDIPSHLYSFSYAPESSWSEVYPSRPELSAYLRKVSAVEGVREHVQFGQEVEEAVWNDATKKWTLRTKQGKEYVGDALILGLGALHVPSVPRIDGVEHFTGKTIHTAQWDESFDPSGKRVLVIGSAASAVQAVPAMSESVSHLYVLQRTASWVVPRLNHAYPKRLLALFEKVPFSMYLMRLLYYVRQELAFFLVFRPKSWTSSAITSLMKKLIRNSVQGHERLANALTPTYPMGCKRILVHSEFYKTFARENVTLVTAPLARVDEQGRVCVRGVRTTSKDGEDGRPLIARAAHAPDGGVEEEVPLEVDAIVYATGFKVMQGFPRIIGKDGRDLVTEVWHEDSPSAYEGITVPGYPNLYVLLGPNTGLGHNSVVWMIECQMNYVLECLVHAVKIGARALEVKAEAHQAFQEDVDKKLDTTVWQSGNCTSWYQNKGGRVFALWPGHTWSYWASLLFPRWSDYEAT